MSTPVRDFEKRDIIDVMFEVSPELDLEEKGDGDKPYYIGTCPFHDDKHPSFAVFPNTQQWKCHAGCGSGDIIDYVKKLLALNFEDAKAIACNTLSPEETFKKHLMSVQIENEVDVRIYNLRMHKLFSVLSYEDALRVMFKLDVFLDENNGALAEQLLKEFGV